MWEARNQRYILSTRINPGGHCGARVFCALRCLLTITWVKSEEISVFQGSIVAPVTPFTASGERVDEDALRKLFRFHLENGTDRVAPVRITGEMPTLRNA